MHYRTVSNYRDFLAEVLGPIGLLPALDMPITDVLGSQVASDVVTDRPVPGFRRVTVDGVAVRAADVAAASPSQPVVLPIADTVPAGFTASEPLAPNQAVRVFVGAPMPENADVVLPLAAIELDLAANEVTITSTAVGGFAAEDDIYPAGELVVSRNTPLDHVAIAALAISGKPRVSVHPRPRVVIVTIGSELVPVSQESAAGLMHDATGVLLATSARSLGADAFRVGPILDDDRMVRDAVEDQLVRADLIVTAGGISSPEDVLRKGLEADQVSRFDGPTISPLTNYGVGRIGPDGVPLVSLPGDPALALLGFHALVRPLIADMLGHDRFGTSEASLPAVQPESGSVISVGTIRDGAFEISSTGGLTLRELVGVNAMAISDAGAEQAQVVMWPL